MPQEKLVPVDIKKIFKDKNPRLAPYIPDFVYRFLKRIIHEDHVNEFIRIGGDRIGADFAKAYVDYAKIKVTIKGEHNLPSGNDRVIFASNHPLGGLDGISLVDYLGHRYPGIKFMVNDILMHMINLRPVFLPINKHGAQAREVAKAIQEAHQGDYPIFTFPAGLVSRRQHGEIKDLRWGKNVVSNAIRYERDIIPIHVSGANSRFFL